MKCFSLLSAVIPAFLFVACSGKPGADSKSHQTPPVVEGYIVKPIHLSDALEVTGTIHPADEAMLMPEVSGKITMLNIKEGEFVSQGTLLVKLFDADLQAQVAKTRAQLATARQTVSRLEELRKVNGVSAQELDVAKTEVASLEADEALINAEISKTEIRAPFSGTLGLRKVSEGAYVTAGTPIVALRREDKLNIDFEVPENISTQFQKGTHISFTLSGDTNSYSATVIATERQINQSALNLQVRAQVDKSNVQITPGASAKVSIDAGSDSTVLAVPTGAIIPDVRYKKVMVAKSGKVNYVNVETGRRTSTDVEIVSGLSAGDTVVTSGIQFLRQGSPAKFSSVK